MKDSPLPTGFREDELGKCDHAIHAPGIEYEVGLVKRGDSYRLLWDQWRADITSAMGGKDASLFLQAYNAEKIKNEIKAQTKNKYRVKEKVTATGAIQIELIER